MGLADLLCQCAEIESRIGDLYQEFAVRWRSDPDLASFSTAMASTERHHASLLSAPAVLAVEKGTRVTDSARWARSKGM